MNFGVLILLTLFISVMIFIVQRSEAKRRLLVTVIMLGIGELIRRYVFFRSETVYVAPFRDLILRLYPRYLIERDIHTEAWLALGLAIVLNVIYWLIVGRYNPVASSDEIQVIGMDD